MNDDVAFAEPYIQITCVDPAIAEPTVLEQFSRYYTEVHAPDVVRNNPGIRRAYRYELHAADPSGNSGPRWLAVYEWETRHGAEVFVLRGEGPGGSWRSDYLPEPPIWSAVGRGPNQWGRLMCNRIGESGPPSPAPFGVLLEGFDAPETASSERRDRFREQLAREVQKQVARQSERGEARTCVRRATVYELEHLGKRAPRAKHPQFLTIYETDESGLTGLAEHPPAAADARVVTWRHVYRRISGRIFPGQRYAAEIL